MHLSTSIKMDYVEETYPVYDRNKVHFLYCFVFQTKPNVEVKLSLLDRLRGVTYEKAKAKVDKAAQKFETYRSSVCDQLIEAGLAVEQFYSVQRDEIYVKVGCSDHRLLEEADFQEYKLELDPKGMKTVALSDKYKGRAPIYLEEPFDPSQKFDGLHLLSNEFTPLSPSELAPYIRAQTHYPPFAHLFARYNDDWERRHLNTDKVQIYKRYPDGSILRTSDRMKLIQIIIERGRIEMGEAKKKGAGLNIGKMVFTKQVLAAFPMQTATATIDAKALSVDELHARWSYFWKFPWNQPLDDIRDYFGEKITLYFAFLGHYTKWLFPAAIVGFCIFAAQMDNVNRNLGSPNFLGASGIQFNEERQKNITKVYTDLDVSPLFALFMALWATFMLEFWKRKESTLALHYGMSNFESVETLRPEFIATHHIPDAVTGKSIPYFSETTFLFKVMTSTAIVGTCICVVIAAVSGIFVLKVFLSLPGKTGIDETNGQYLALVINAFVIQFLGQVYSKVAKGLNDWENHRTDTAFEDSLIAKTFLFSFINSYATLFYMAFIKNNVTILEQKQYCFVPAKLVGADDACFADLGASLLIIFATQIVVNNTMEVVIPAITGFITARANMGSSKTAVGEKKEAIVKSPAEDQFYLQSYDGTLGDFLEIALQFGYASLFVTAFPLAPFLAFVNNWLEVKVDSFKLCKLCRRPEMRGAQDIGTWQTIFETVGFIAVVTNAAVVVFVSRVIVNLIDAYNKPKFPITDIRYAKEIEAILILEGKMQIWCFLIFVSFIIAFKIFVGYFLPDVPKAVTIQLARNDYLVRKCLLLEPDDEDGGNDEDDSRPAAQTVDVKVHTVDPEIDDLLTRIHDAFSQNGHNVREIFSSIDKNKNGEVDKYEFMKALKKASGIDGKIPESIIETLINALDNNGNGRIDAEEFEAFWNRNQNKV